MKYMEDLSPGQSILFSAALRHGGTTIPKGALVMRGTTTGTNTGFCIVAANACTDSLGVTESALASTVTDSDAAGTTENRIKVLINPLAIYLAEYSQATADTFTPTSSSSTTLTIAANEQISGGWFYVTAGTGLGQLQYTTATTNGTYTTKTAFAPVLDATSYLVRIPARYSILANVVTAADKLASQAAAGSSKITILENYMQSGSVPFAVLSALSHSGLTGLNSDTPAPKFFSAIHVRTHVLGYGLS